MRKKPESFDIPVYKVLIPRQSMELVNSTLTSGWIGGDGPRVIEFETRIAEIINNKNVVAVNSGTSALELALRIVDVEDGEVISTPMTCIATNAAIVNQGGVPIWADIDPTSGNIDPHDIERKITGKTKAIMVVHLGGNPAYIDKINQLARKYKIPVIEDAAQAFGSRYGKKLIGNHSDFVVFSFQATKIVTTADGGVLVTKRPAHAKHAKILRWYGIDREARIWGKTSWDYPIEEIGYKMQMTDIAASIGLGQLPHLRRNLLYRNRIARIYDKAVTKSKLLYGLNILPGSEPNFWLYMVLCKDDVIKTKLAASLNKIGVEALEIHQRNDTYPVFKDFKNGPLPGVDKFCRTHLCIPIGKWVSLVTAKRISSILKSF